MDCPVLRTLAVPFSKLLGVCGALPELTSLDLSGVLLALSDDWLLAM